ncbi:diguanylate cyclase domain-containing protein [Pseudohongiella spirulinae]|uniref:PAS domain S-box/diguanylate cyclase (GGDEF) domain-containing protein n=1 Tax=Pseudohongiella spirulinae TaxID=1249552 RepID=A0A0S2KA05_9GAMM|nr:diguanylate cyclase [Pseudohongiella spirulinae]ALO44965.1 PAS domain S-box/diguanylate cyclase (GGDEF) domain-containing protein [Pseudohongiella spirulinae]
MSDPDESSTASSVDIHAICPKLINLIMDTVFVVDGSGVILFVNDACETLLGYAKDELIGTPIRQYVYPGDLDSTMQAAQRVISGQPHIHFENRYLRKDGSIVNILWSARWDDEQQVRIGVARDITALKQAEEELRFLAHHDPLTGLTNRHLFNDRLETALRAAEREHRPLALLYLDLNDFKRINDGWGHEAGDYVIKDIARRLESGLRKSDTIGRIGGDEFTILLTDVSEPSSVDASMVKIRRILEVPIEYKGEHFRVGCSIGVARYPEDGDTARQLLNTADSRMYADKRKVE